MRLAAPSRMRSSALLRVVSGTALPYLKPRDSSRSATLATAGDARQRGYRGLVLGIVDLALRRPWALLGANLAVAAIAIVASLGAPGDLGVGSTHLDGARQEALAVVLERDRATGPGALAVAQDVVASQLEADPAIGSVRVVRDRQRRSVLVAELEAISAAAREDAVERIERDIDPGQLQVTVGGETPALIEARRFLGDDLWRLGLLVLPLVLLLAVVATGIRLAIAPVVCTVTAVAGSLALLRLTGVVFDVSLLGIAPALVVGTVLGTETPALVARFHREEAAISPAPAALGAPSRGPGPCSPVRRAPARCRYSLSSRRRSRRRPRLRSAARSPRRSPRRPRLRPPRQRSQSSGIGALRVSPSPARMRAGDVGSPKRSEPFRDSWLRAGFAVA